jgi:hypothetical protein
MCRDKYAFVGLDEPPRILSSRVIFVSCLFFPTAHEWLVYFQRSVRGE